MYTEVNEIHIPITECTVKPMYEVQYDFYEQDYGPDIRPVMRSYQVFDDEHTANIIAKMIENGDILPPIR